MGVLSQYTADIPLEVCPSTAYDRSDKLDMLGEPLCEQRVPRNVPLKRTARMCVRPRVSQRELFRPAAGQAAAVALNAELMNVALPEYKMAGMALELSCS